MVEDLFGKQINIGDVIVYPVRKSSYVRMSKAVVIDILSFTSSNWRGTYTRYELKCRRFSDVYGTQKMDLKKEVRVNNPNQILLERYMLPQEYIDLLNQEGL